MNTEVSEGFVFVIYGGAVDWKARSRFHCDACDQSVFMAASEAVQLEAVWIRKFVGRSWRSVPLSQRVAGKAVIESTEKPPSSRRKSRCRVVGNAVVVSPEMPSPSLHKSDHLLLRRLLPKTIVVAIITDKNALFLFKDTEITSDSNIILYSQYLIESQQVAVQNSNSSVQQDDLILYVIEHLKTQVVHCTKTNLENKSVNDTLTAKLERYKEQVKVLKEGQKVDLKSQDNVSDSCAQSVEIDHLKRTLSEHLKENESLLQTVTLLKNDFKKEESRNLDTKIALEKQIKHLDNNVFKRDQSDETSKTNPIVIPDSEETLTLAEESRSKMLLKHKDNMMQEKIKQIDTTPIDYAALNKLYKDFETRFVPQTELSAEQAFWSHNSVSSSEPDLSDRPTNVEVPKELPKVSMVNTSLKKLKYHLANFDVVVKERTTPTAITEGTWGFEHTKACFRDEIIPFVKALKDLFSTFNQQLVDELAEVQNVFYQMEQVMEQHRVESKTFEVKMNQALNGNERLLEHVMSKDIVNLMVNSSMHFDYVNVLECEKCLKLKTGLQKDFVEKEIYDKLFKRFTTLEKHCISLEVDTQLNQEIFQRDNSISNQSAPSFDQLFELNELKAQFQEKDMVIKKLKERIKSLTRNIDKDKIKYRLEEEKVLVITTLKDELRKLKGKDLANNEVTHHPSDPEIITEPITAKLLNKRSAHSAYIKHTQEEAEVLRDLHSKLNTNSKLKCVKCNGCMLYDNHDLCVLDYINNVNARAKSKSAKKQTKRKVWKPTGKMFTTIRYIWRPTGRIFTIIGNACPLTRVTTTTEVPLRKPIILDNETSKPAVTLVYSRKPRKSKTNVPVSKSKAEAVATTCYTQNHSIIRLCHGKTPYELLHDKLSDLSFFHVFGALCYPTNDSKNLGKLQPKADIDFDELTAMASEHSSSGPTLHEMTPATISSGLMPKPPPLFDELLNPPPSVDHPTPEVVAPIDEVAAPEPAVSTNIEEDNHDIEVAHMGNDPYFSNAKELNDLHRLLKYKEAPTRPDKWLELPVKTRENDFEELLLALQELKAKDVFHADVAHEEHGSVDPTLFIRKDGKELLLISQSPRGIFINHSKYDIESLKKYDFDSCDPVDTPMVEKYKLDEDKEGKAVDPSHYCDGIIAGCQDTCLKALRYAVWKLNILLCSAVIVDVEELYRLVKNRYSASSPEGFDLMLWGDLHTLFEPDKDDEIWRDQHEYNLLSWRLCDFCGIHILLMDNGLAIHMLTEKKYPLSQEMLTKMLSRKLEVDHESSQAFELLRFIRSQVQK
ncbi:hypothetical protein Tco_0497815 [Tanacetum coccineum]